jgi:hypothetical protein
VTNSVGRPRVNEPSDATWRKRLQRERDAAAVIMLRQTLALKEPGPQGCILRRMKGTKAQSYLEAQRRRWEDRYGFFGLVIEPFVEADEIEIREPKKGGGLQSWNKVQYGTGLHRRGWRDNESGTDNETGDIRLAEEINKPLDYHRTGRTERAIEKVDKSVDYDDDASIANDREATIEAARLNKRLAKKLAKQRRIVDVEKGDDDQPDIAVYDLKTEGSRRFGDDTEVTVQRVVTETVADDEANFELDLDSKSNGILNALARNQDRAIPLVSEYSSQAARPRR